MNFPVIAIGASAGGLEAITELLKILPEEIDSSYIIIQHLNTKIESNLTEILQRHTALKVVEITAHLQIKKRTVYIIPYTSDIIIKNGYLELISVDENQKLHLPIDTFFTSFAKECKEKAIAILLSGSGSDGTRGFSAIQEFSGSTLVQTLETASFDDMPRSAILHTKVEAVLPIALMPDKLRAIIKKKFSLDKSSNKTEIKNSILDLILQTVYQHSSQDFQNYKTATILRRIARRMRANKITSLEKYQNFIQNNAAEIDLLYNDLLIVVTSFFRDPAAFDYAEKNILPLLLKSAKKRNLRIWVAGCATGEEAYTWAMIVQKYSETHNLKLNCQIFATDLNEKAIIKARKGIFDFTVIGAIPEKYISYLIPHDHGYQIQKQLRDMIVFAKHNFLQEPPFSNIDLVSCRNVLIYFKRELQMKAIEIFAYSLTADGVLFLGSSEVMNNNTEYLQILNSKYKFFLKRGNFSESNNLWSTNYSSSRYGKEIKKMTKTTSIEKLTQNYFLDKLTPTSVVIDSLGNMVYATGKTGKYLEINKGIVSTNIIKVARKEIKIPLSNAFHTVKLKKIPVRVNNLKIQISEHDEFFVDLKIDILDSQNTSQEFYIVIFEDIKVETNKNYDDTQFSENEIIRDLQRKLIENEQFLKSSIEELAESNEELKSVNEEVQSGNEELQSSNEELETSREELQSVNEELSTTNSELKAKIDDLARLNDDLSNFLASTRIATIFLDRELRIKRFTPEVFKIIDLVDTDVGRPLSNFNIPINYQALQDDLQRVLETLVPKQKEVQLGSQYYWLQIYPYRTLDHHIDGLVLTFTNITENKKIELELDSYKNNLEDLVKKKTELLQKSEQSLLLAQSVGKMGSFEYNLKTRQIEISMTLKSLLKIEKSSISNKDFEQIIYKKDIAKWKQAMLGKKSKGSDLSCELRIQVDENIFLWVRLQTALMEYQDHENRIIVGTIQDITQEKEILGKYKEAKEKAEKSANVKTQFLANMSHEIRTPLNSVIGFSELLAQSDLGSSEAKMVDSIQTSSISLLSIINDILDLSKIEAGKLEIHPEKADLYVIFEEIISIIKIAAIKKDTVVQLKLDPALPRFAEIDANRLKQIILNLMANSVKFTEKGKIELRVKFRKITQNTGAFKITVFDTGTGITKKESTEIFNAYIQGDPAKNKTEKGTGLGLSISNLLAQKMGSKIQFKSEPGKRTEFYFSLETNFWDAEFEDKKNSVFKKIILLNLDRPSVKIITESLEGSAAKITIESSEQNLLQKEKNISDHDLVVVQYRKEKEEDIFLILKKVRPDTHTMLLYKNEDLLSIEKLLMHYDLPVHPVLILKPLKKSIVLRSLESMHIAQKSGRIKVSKRSGNLFKPISDKVFKIMVAEDQQMNQILICTIIKKYLPKAVLFTCVNGKEVVQKIQKQKIDLIIMDIQMPEMNGIEATKIIKASRSKRIRNTPVLALTAGVLEAEKNTCFEVGMQGFLMKPINQTELRAELINILKINTIEIK